jgi:hypothetical protein
MKNFYESILTPLLLLSVLNGIGESLEDYLGDVPGIGFMYPLGDIESISSRNTVETM